MPTMYIKSLSVSCFRNLSSLNVEFTKGVNIIVGDNGSGKTNLLEAIHVLCLGRSQRGAGDLVLLNHKCDVYRLEGRLASEKETFDLATGYQRGGRKKLTIDGLSARLSELYDHISLASAGPEDSTIIGGSPSQRRSFLDIYISQLTKSYLANLSNYQRALAQKNAALRAERDGTPFDSILVELGSLIIRERCSFLNRLSLVASQYYKQLSDGEKLTIQYQPSVSFDQKRLDLKDIAANMESRLNEVRRRETAMKTAVVGPHRDDIYFAVGGLPARSHGSQGQWRSIAIALKLAVYQLLREYREETPILLLDEVFAELDQKRAAALVEAFADFGQLFITTALSPPELLRRRGRIFKIMEGTIAADNCDA
ncbi:MAG: DNA replication/repair protein RecF [candidate division Zixibacteria bacterium]|nr:DNA replication/repair protein RecF [candidate division Zixibacteria bacterium]